eukprot:Blabericola_migrator_1__6632@NODE_3347_length_1839_cov_772_893341_g749_i2_p1_GENE_NODE_3347_length_1839_cov_772_893341_g749_i2NODE_3347_length_1839_cov_772_893341_g749_i2_p1_ORF_typecomplete_len323_score38_16FAM153/PF15722_5/8_1e02FAM153/PF15722_5/0_23Mucin15/PF15672_5/0_12_NODE_3347_length_1839_cov_772_893341_g749_i24741442
MEHYGESAQCVLATPIEKEKEKCKSAGPLRQKYERDPTSLTADEELEWAELQAWMGPYDLSEWPGLGWGDHPITGVDPNDVPDLTLEESDCAAYDYPDYTDLMKWLVARKIYPLFITAQIDPDTNISGSIKYWPYFAQEVGQLFGIYDRVEAENTFNIRIKTDASDLYEKLIEPFGNLTEHACQTFPSPSPTTTSTPTLSSKTSAQLTTTAHGADIVTATSVPSMERTEVVETSPEHHISDVASTLTDSSYFATSWVIAAPVNKVKSIIAGAVAGAATLAAAMVGAAARRRTPQREEDLQADVPGQPMEREAACTSVHSMYV